MNTRHTAAGLCTAALLALTACSTSSNSTQPDKSPASHTASTPAGLTAKQAAAKLADATGVTTLGNPTDNTGGCSNATGKDATYNCVQLITTDTVSIYEFKTAPVAKHWVDSMKKVGNDWRQVGRFALAWTARDQTFTSDERRAQLVAALKKATANES
ncbi:hypothetical protein [Streptomyces sp. NPDC047028]|uniref:hypothetical protein n=1 Tax=Streptomyces sp. NPDC047028 TaxID=3155793 RepID=UPI0033EC1C89